MIKVDASAFISWMKQLAVEVPRAVESGLAAGVRLAEEDVKGSDAWKDRTRAMRKSIRVNGSGFARRLSVNVPYAKYIDEGSPAHEILPRRKKWLRFMWHGQMVYRLRVYHPGTVARRFMAKAGELGEQAAAHIIEVKVHEACK